MKVRCSNGLQVSAYHGNFTHHTFGADLEFGVIDADKAISVMFSVRRQAGLKDRRSLCRAPSSVHNDCASGQRRVRCHNLVASVTESGDQALKYVDEDAVTTVIAKEAASRSTRQVTKRLA